MFWTFSHVISWDLSNSGYELEILIFLFTFLLDRESKRTTCSRFISFKNQDTMGCFPVLKSKMKQTTYLKLNNDPKEHSPAALPEPQLLTRSLQSAPPSLKAVYKASNNRMPALSPSSILDAAEQDALCSVKFDENEDSRYEVSLNEQQQQSPNPLPLPLPSPQAHSTATLKPVGSFMSLASSGPLYTSGPLPLPPCETLRNFSNDEIAAACRNSSPEGCISEGLSFVTYKASFGDYASGLKKFDATVTRLQISHQVPFTYFCLWWGPIFLHIRLHILLPYQKQI